MAGAAAIVTIAVSSAPARPVKGAPGCPVFPASNQWNRRVDKLPLAGRSDAIVKSIGLGTGLHADFGSGKYAGGPSGNPNTTVSRSQPKVHVKFTYTGETDNGP